MALFDIRKELFNGGKTISVIRNEVTGDKYKTGNPSTDTMNFAKKIRKTYAVSTTSSATLNTAAFLVKALVKKELRIAATSKGWNVQQVYAEFRHANQDGSFSEFKFSCSLNPKIVVSYEGEAPEEGSPYVMLPYVLTHVAFSDDEELQDELAGSVYNINADRSKLAVNSVFRFCDSFYWNTKNVWPETQFEAYGGTLKLESIKMERQNGYLHDIACEEDYEFLPDGLKKLVNEAECKFDPCEVFSGISVKKKAPKKKNNKTRSSAATKWKKMLKEIKAGKYLIQYEWDENQKKHVPSMGYLDTYVPTEEFYEILRKIEYRLGERMMEKAMFPGLATADDIKSDIVNILLYGDPGSGKTALVHAIGATTGMPVYSVKFNEDSEDDVFEGKNKIVGGKISFVGTDFLEGFEKGGLILMEEINLGRANMLTSVMNQALEYPFYVEKNGYEKITRHPLVAAFATMNLDTDGTMTLNSAMAQRFNNKYMIGEPSSKDFKTRLVANGYKEERVDYVYNVYDKIRTFLKETAQKQKYLKELSIRQCIAALNDMEEGTDARRAVFNTMYGAICIKNRKLADQIKEGILDTVPDYVEE